MKGSFLIAIRRKGKYEENSKNSPYRCQQELFTALHLGCNNFRMLQSMQEIHRALGMGGGGENRTLVLLEDFQPAFDIGGMIISAVTSRSS